MASTIAQALIVDYNDAQDDLIDAAAEGDVPVGYLCMLTRDMLAAHWTLYCFIQENCRDQTIHAKCGLVVADDEGGLHIQPYAEDRRLRFTCASRSVDEIGGVAFRQGQIVGRG